MSFFIYLYMLKKDPLVLEDKAQEKQEIKNNKTPEKIMDKF